MVQLELRTLLKGTATDIYIYFFYQQWYVNQQPFAYWPNALTSRIPAVSVERGQCRAEAMHTSQVPILAVVCVCLDVVYG